MYMYGKNEKTAIYVDILCIIQSYISIYFQENNSFETTLAEDKFSDTSEEVTASDSGKGGSEDELPLQSHGKYSRIGTKSCHEFHFLFTIFIIKTKIIWSTSSEKCLQTYM